MRIFKKKKKIFGGDIEPSCQYCRYNSADPEGDDIICIYAGSGVCKKYEYDPLRRSPKGLPKLRSYSPEDFSL